MKMTKPHDTIQEQSIVEENKSHFKIRKKWIMKGTYWMWIYKFAWYPKAGHIIFINPI